MIVGLTWYTPDTWAQVKASAADPESFDESFDKWKLAAVAARRDLQRSGVMALECRIVPEEFTAWCVQNGEENNSAARAEYVSQVLTASRSGKA